MQAHRLPVMPDALLPHHPVLVGRSARAHLADLPMRLFPECALVMDEDAFVSGPGITATPDPVINECWRLDGWRVWLAPEGLVEHLQNRMLPLDALGVRADGAVVDPLAGYAVLESGQFGEWQAEWGRDPALPLKALALAAETGVHLEQRTLHAVGEAGKSIFRVKRCRIAEMVTEVLLSQRPDAGLMLVQASGLMALILPEVEALVDFHKSSRHHHKDVWRHTCQVVAQSVPRFTVRWAALLHDIGKVYTRSYAPKGKVHFFSHDDVGAYLFEGIAARLEFETESAETIRGLIQHHLRPGLYQSTWKDAAIRRFDREMGPLLDELLHLARADVTSARPGVRRRAIHSLYELRTRIETLREKAHQQRNRVPRGLGVSIIRDLNVEPGPRVGELRSLCEDAVKQGALPESPAVEDCIAFLKKLLAA